MTLEKLRTGWQYFWTALAIITYGITCLIVGIAHLSFDSLIECWNKHP